MNFYFNFFSEALLIYNQIGKDESIVYAYEKKE